MRSLLCTKSAHTSRWTISLCISEYFICILPPRFMKQTQNPSLKQSTLSSHTLSIQLKFLLILKDYKICRTYTFQLYMYVDQQIQYWHIMKDCNSKHCCHCHIVADTKTQQRSQISHLTLREGVLLLLCHPGQQILLALAAFHCMRKTYSARLKFHK